MSPKTILRKVPLWTLTAVALVGCSPGEGGDGAAGTPDLSKKVPVSGVVTVDGKPVPKVVVTFLPQTGGTGVGETDADGRYELQSYGSKGLLPGKYKVAVSYLVSAEGAPQGLGPRSAISQPPGMLTAKEHLPAEYSDLGRTTLTAEVGEKGGTFNFDVKGMTPVEPATGKNADEGKPAPAAAGTAKPAAEKPDEANPAPDKGVGAEPSGKK